MSSENQPQLPAKTTARLFWLVAGGSAAVLAVATAATLFARHHWFADLLSNLRVQQCLALLVLGIIFLAGQKWKWFFLIGLCLAIHIPWFLSGRTLRADSAPVANPLRITLANVASSNQRHEAIVADIVRHQPDVFVILELNPSLATRLQSELGKRYVDSIVRPMSRGSFGIGLYSRYPIEDHVVFTLNSDIESIASMVNVDGKRYRIIATHPLPPMGAGGSRLRNEHLQQLAVWIQDAAAGDSTPIVLVGDLNVTPWSPHFQDFATDSKLVRVGGRFDLTPTWYRYPSFPFGLVLDHVMVSKGLVAKQYMVGPDIGSDHRSVSVTLGLGIGVAEHQD